MKSRFRCAYFPSVRAGPQTSLKQSFARELKFAKSLKDFPKPSDEVLVPADEGPRGKEATGIT